MANVEFNWSDSLNGSNSFQVADTSVCGRFMIASGVNNADSTYNSDGSTGCFYVSTDYGRNFVALSTLKTANGYIPGKVHSLSIRSQQDTGGTYPAVDQNDPTLNTFLQVTFLAEIVASNSQIELFSGAVNIPGNADGSLGVSTTLFSELPFVTMFNNKTYESSSDANGALSIQGLYVGADIDVFVHTLGMLAVKYSIEDSMITFPAIIDISVKNLTNNEDDGASSSGKWIGTNLRAGTCFWVDSEKGSMRYYTSSGMTELSAPFPSWDSPLSMTGSYGALPGYVDSEYLVLGTVLTSDGGNALAYCPLSKFGDSSSWTTVPISSDLSGEPLDLITMQFGGDYSKFMLGSTTSSSLVSGTLAVDANDPSVLNISLAKVDSSLITSPSAAIRGHTNGLTYILVAPSSEPGTSLLVGDAACFLAGSWILTSAGETRIEALLPGTQVVTRKGLRRLMRVGRKALTSNTQIYTNGDLRVLGGHSLLEPPSALHTGRSVQGMACVLARDHPDFERANRRGSETEYFHLVLDPGDSCAILANGLWTESMEASTFRQSFT